MTNCRFFFFFFCKKGFDADSMVITVHPDVVHDFVQYVM